MFNTVIGILLLISAVFLVVSILLQSSKSHKMPGTIAGGAETFFGKTKGSSIDRVLQKLTAVVAVIFCLLVIVMYVAQDTSSVNDSANTTAADAETTVADDTTAVEGETTVADDTTAAEGEDTTVADDTTAAEGEDTAAAEETTAAEGEDTTAEETTAAE